jgi:hypothetical protein
LIGSSGSIGLVGRLDAQPARTTAAMTMMDRVVFM